MVSVKIIRRTICLLILSVLGACSAEQLPTSARLAVYPSGKSIEVSGSSFEQNSCYPTDEFYQDVPIIIALHDSQGGPLGNHYVSVHLDLSENTFTGWPFLALYIDQNSNGVVDHPEERVSGIADSLLVLKTAPYTGHVNAILRINLSCEYSGELMVFSGHLVASATFSVVGPQ